MIRRELSVVVLLSAAVFMLPGSLGQQTSSQRFEGMCVAAKEHFMFKIFWHHGLHPACRPGLQRYILHCAEWRHALSDCRHSRHHSCCHPVSKPQHHRPKPNHCGKHTCLPHHSATPNSAMPNVIHDRSFCEGLRIVVQGQTICIPGKASTLKVANLAGRRSIPK